MRLVLLLSNIAGILLVCADPGCPDGYNISTVDSKTCYIVYNTPQSQTDAEFQCKSDGGHLASVHNGFANSQLYSMATNVSVTSFWLGIQCTDITVNSCSNIDGTTFGPHYNFAPGNPSALGNCVYMSTTKSTAQKWISFDCDQTFAFACEAKHQSGISCAAGYEEFDENCYKVFANSPEENAQMMCENDCGSLTSIHTDEENEFVLNLAAQSFPNEIYVRIGLVEYKNSTIWLDKSKLDYSRIEYESQNLGNCFAMALTTEIITQGNWTRTSCNSALSYVCKTPKSTCTRTTSSPLQCPAPTTPHTATLTGNGTIVSPGFPNTYQQSHCIYLITSPEGTIVQVQFPIFALDASSSIQLYNDLADAQPFQILNSTTDVSTSHVFQSSENEMKIIFTTGSTISATATYRWELVFSAAAPSVCSVTPAQYNTTLTQGGTIYSPGYPNMYQSSYCVYLISSPPGTFVQVHLPIFDLDDSSSIMLYNNSETTQPFKMFTSASHVKASDVFQSSGNEMKVAFLTGLNTPAAGDYKWELTYATSIYEILPNGGCQQVTYAPGIITTPNYPDNYPENTVCQNHLESTNRKRILLTFTCVNLSPLDVINVYDGPSANGNYPWIQPTLKNQGTPNLNQTYQSTGHQITVTWASDKGSSAPGFSSVFIED